MRIGLLRRRGGGYILEDARRGDSPVVIRFLKVVRILIRMLHRDYLMKNCLRMMRMRKNFVCVSLDVGRFRGRTYCEKIIGIQ